MENTPDEIIPPVRRKKGWKFWLQILIMVYCGIGIALYYLQGYFLFHPKKLPADHVFRFTTPFKEVSIPINQEDTISLIQFFPASIPTKGVVLYFHGNKDNVERYARFADNFTKYGYEVWMPDYPGFGKSSGERNERKLYEQAYQVKRLAQGKFADSQMVIYGKSFGTGIAAYVASVSKPKQLLLETPYSSIPDLFSCYAPIYPTSYMAEYKIPTATFLQDVDAPVTIFHGTSDGVIPYRCAARLKKVLKKHDQFITIEEGTHHNLSDFPIYKKILDTILRK